MPADAAAGAAREQEGAPADAASEKIGVPAGTEHTWSARRIYKKNSPAVNEFQLT